MHNACVQDMEVSATQVQHPQHPPGHIQPERHPTPCSGRVPAPCLQGEEVFETELQRALKFAHSRVKLIIAAQQQLRAEAGQEPMLVELSGADPSAAHNVEAYALPVVQEVLSNPDSTPAEQLVGLREAQQRTLDHLKARGRYRHAVSLGGCLRVLRLRGSTPHCLELLGPSAEENGTHMSSWRGSLWCRMHTGQVES